MTWLMLYTSPCRIKLNIVNVYLPEKELFLNHLEIQEALYVPLTTCITSCEGNIKGLLYSFRLLRNSSFIYI